MRDIKFRAWHEYGKSVNPAQAGMIYDEKPGDCLTWKNQGQKITDIMQFTGLKDMDNIDIYEGDIIKLSYGIPPTTDSLVVVWYSEYYLEMDDQDGTSYCGWWFKNIRPNGCSAPAGLEYQDSIKIIGNIHENPELLEIGEDK